MKIETKYNIGDEVWFGSIHFNYYRGEIIRIGCLVYKDNSYVIRYTIKYKGYTTTESESNVFPTKEELLKGCRV